MATRWRAVILLLLVTVACPACWSGMPIEELAYVSAMAIDAGASPGGVRLTLAIVRPPQAVPPAGASGGARELPFYTVSGDGATLGGALAHIAAQTSREVFLGEVQAVVFGQGIAERGIGPYLDFLERDPQLRPSLLVYTAEGSAQHALEVSTTLERLPHNVFRGIREHVPRRSLTGVQVKDFVDYIDEPGVDSTSPLVMVDCVHARAATQSGVRKCPGGETPELREVGTAVYRRDRLAVLLVGRESLPLRWLAGWQVDSDVLVRRAGGRLATVRVRAVQRSVRVALVAGAPRVTVDLKVGADMIDNPGEPGGLTERSLQRWDASLGETMSRLTRTALTRCFAAGTDPLGAGWWLERHDPAVWGAVRGRWRALLPRAAVDVRVSAAIRGNGLVR